MLVHGTKVKALAVARRERSGRYHSGIVVAWFLTAGMTPGLAGDPPLVASYPCQTAIRTTPFEGAAAELTQGTPPVWWSVFNAPPGMMINPEDGTITWPDPTEGRHAITICATNMYGADYVEWVLRVVANDISDPVIVSTQHIDFVVPGDIAAWIETWGAEEHVDACWERMRYVIGQEPLNDRQIVKYDPDGEGGAHSGNPVESGPYWWSLDPVRGWLLGVWLHEVGHNFHAETRIGGIIDNNWADSFFHHGMELTQTSVEARALEDPEGFGLSGESVVNFQAFAQWLRQEYERRCQPYLDWLGAGGRAEEFAQDPENDTYAVWAWICRELCDAYGPEILENSLRAVRVDGLAQEVYDLCDTPLKKNTLMFCIMSCAAAEDLRAYFDDWGFDADDAFYSQILPSVTEAMSQLPDEDVHGWKQCPLNGRYYRLTPWSMFWYEAERSARRRGGHLATVRSEAEDQWLVSRFGNKRPLWIGLNDQQEDGVWVWSSGEPITYTNWGPGEPSGGVWEYFVALNWSGSGQWNDVDSAPRYHGIIETTSAPTPPGDLNGDGCVGHADLGILLGDWDCTGQDCAGDIDGDGDTDHADLGILLAHWGEGCP